MHQQSIRLQSLIHPTVLSDNCAVFNELKCTCNRMGFYIFVMFSTFRDEKQNIFWLLKMSELTSFKAMQMRFLLFRATKTTQMTSVPASLTAEKTLKMKFFSKKIYCISSWNVLNIANMQNPKWLHMRFNCNGSS